MYIKQVRAGVLRAPGARGEAGCPGATRGVGVGGGEGAGPGRAAAGACPQGAGCGAGCGAGPSRAGRRARRAAARGRAFPGGPGCCELVRGCGGPRRSAGTAVHGPLRAKAASRPGAGLGWADRSLHLTSGFAPRRADPCCRTRRACSLGCLLLSKWSSRARGMSPSADAGRGFSIGCARLGASHPYPFLLYLMILLIFLQLSRLGWPVVCLKDALTGLAARQAAASSPACRLSLYCSAGFSILRASPRATLRQQWLQAVGRVLANL